MGYVAGSHPIQSTLIIVPCGRAKVWDRRPDTGPVSARDAYTGYPFRINVQYAERFGARWVILSAKYGFIDPEFVIPGPYDVSYNRRASGPVSRDQLRGQLIASQLDGWGTVIGLGGRHYRDAIASAFECGSAALYFPFAGLPLGRMVQATRRAIERGDPALR